jgi:DnaK suppressor protein
VTPERAEELLTQARERTEAELARGTVRAGDEQQDASSDADSLVQGETDEALRELLTQRLEAIERAQERLRAGTFGRSVTSGDPIPDARLEIEPWAEFTVEEQPAR